MGFLASCVQSRSRGWFLSLRFRDWFRVTYTLRGGKDPGWFGAKANSPVPCTRDDSWPLSYGVGGEEAPATQALRIFALVSSQDSVVGHGIWASVRRSSRGFLLHLPS